MTIYEKELAAAVEKRCGGMSVAALLEQLVAMGVVDYTRCKVLAVREYVASLMRGGNKKIDSMWIASEKFCCSYEYVRKCIYYYKDVNL